MIDLRKAKDIIYNASEIEVGDSLFVPVFTKKEQLKTFTVLNNLAKEFVENINPKVSFEIVKTFQDKRLWIKITKKPTVEEVFVKKKSGEIQAMNISSVKGD